MVKAVENARMLAPMPPTVLFHVPPPACLYSTRDLWSHMFAPYTCSVSAHVCLVLQWTYQSLCKHRRTICHIGYVYSPCSRVTQGSQCYTSIFV